MEVREVIVTHVIGPILLLLLVARFRPCSRFDALLTASAVTVPFAFLWMAGRWHLATIWFRYALPLGIFAVAMICWRRGRRLPLYASNGTRTWLLRCVKVGVAGYTLVLSASAIAGFRAGEPMVSLTFPLRNGHFYVGQGGTTAALNYHVVNRTQRHALDVVKLAPWGNRSVRLYPRKLDEYASYGASVYAPCGGVVKHAEGSLRDNEVNGERDRARPAGNQVLIRCVNTDVDVLMSHLRAGSVRVRSGDVVEAGVLVGAIGNSGNSTEPHLHIHAKRGGPSDSGLSGEGVPMAFNGRFLTRNATISDLTDHR